VNILEGKPLPIYGDGRNVRDWLYVTDHCHGISLVLESGQSGETYNIGGHSECDNLTLVEMLCGIVDERFERDASLRQRYPQAPAARGAQANSLIRFVKDRPGHDRRYAIDAGKITRTLGFKPSRNLADGLRETVDWYLANEPWWRAVMNGSYRDWIARQYQARN
jgi:dTDP-glucose 4,6-dehydratase